MKYFCAVATLFLSISLFSQKPNGGGKKETSGEVFGAITDSVSKENMGYVTILLLSEKDSSVVSGAVSKENGTFSIPDVPSGKYMLKFSFVGYSDKWINNVQISPDNPSYQLKMVTMAPKTLGVVQVNGDIPEITYEIDKKVINVEDQINAEGMSAVELLQNIPSVTVSSDGTVSLRGSSSFTLLIDGVPTVMDASDALNNIPASSIKNIEVITNPSARFDAEGTSGVINIITKKSKLEGVSCLINANTGTFENYGGDIALNLKKGAWTFDLKGNYNQRGRPNETNVIRTTSYDSVTNVLISEGESNWRRANGGIVFGTQWKPNNSHTFSFNTNLSNTLMNPYDDAFFQSYDDGELVEEFSNFQRNNIDILNSTTNFFYQYNIKRNPDHNIGFKAIYSYRDVTQFDTTLSYREDGSIRSGNLYTETGPSAFFRFNLDYQLPLKKSRKFMVGFQSQLGTSGDVGKNFTYDLVSESFEFNPLFSSDVDYVRDVHAGYTMFNGKHKSFGYQLGVRAEYTYRTISSSTATEFAEINRLDWFPSAHFSYSLPNKAQVLLSYSRRIERPRSYFFEPFITWEGPFNVRTGNPNLEPQYINALEMSYVKPLGARRGYFSTEVYYRLNRNEIDRISTVYEEGILISQPYNIGNSSSIGVEPSLSYKIKDWWEINLGGNLFYFELNGQLDDVIYDASSFNYNGRFTNTFKIKDWVLQTVSSYRSGSVSAQGRTLSNFSQDVSLRKSFFNKKLSMTLQGRNILGTARRASFTETENVLLDNERRPLYPQVMLSVSLRLNNYQRVRDRNEVMDDF